MHIIQFNKLSARDRALLRALIEREASLGRNFVPRGEYSVKIPTPKWMGKTNIGEINFYLSYGLLIRTSKKNPAMKRIEVIEAPIGQGGSGAVFSSLGVLRQETCYKLKTGNRRVLKVSTGVGVTIPKEVHITGLLPDRHVKGPFFFSIGNRLQTGLIMDYIPGRTLDYYIQPGFIQLRLNLLLHVTMQILIEVQALHNRGVIHNDLKPSNIIVKDDCSAVTIVDFGLSGSPGVPPSRGGTIYYIAPELFNTDPNRLADILSDTWSVAMVLLELWGYNGIQSAEKLDMGLPQITAFHLWRNFLRNQFYISLGNPSFGFLKVEGLTSTMCEELGSIFIEMLAHDPTRRLRIPNAIERLQAFQDNLILKRKRTLYPWPEADEPKPKTPRV